jgi:thiamine-monophosphate kinase
VPADSAGLVIGSGDDAAVSLREGAAVTSVDALVEGVHFRMPPFSPADVGHKALAVALSDLAAMGASPEEAYVQLGVPEEVDDDTLLELADGLGRLAAEHGVAVAGGDVTRAPALLCAMTVVGSVSDPAAAVRRGGAQPGDVVAVTGALGGAAAGLLALDRPELAAALEPAAAERLRLRQLRPFPRLAAGRALAEAGATSMIDISDGLGADAGHVAAASGAALGIEVERVPVEPGVSELAGAAGVDPLDLALAGGEDYELLVTLPEQGLEAAVAAVAATGTSLSAIGEVTPGEGVLLSEGGAATRQPSGFDQLRSLRAPGALP